MRNKGLTFMHTCAELKSSMKMNEKEAYSAALIIDFRHPCPKSNRKPRGDYKASNAHLRTDLPKNKPTVSFLKASTAYMALRLERS